MMTFEYLMVHVVQSTNWATIASLPADNRPEQTFTLNARISRPGAMAEEIAR
jgi:hypothetical protein